MAGGLIVATAGAAGAAKATGTPVKFGVVATLTGPEGEPEGVQGLTAYVKNWNAHGGYKGHPVQVIVEDDQLNPSLYSSEARQLVIQDGVIGMLSEDGVGLDCEINNPFYISEQIGVLGGGCVPGTYNPKYDFALASPTTSTAGLAILAKYAVLHGKKKIGILLPPLPFQQLEANLAKYVSSIGGHVVLPVTTLPLTPTAADVDGALAQLKSEGVDA